METLHLHTGTQDLECAAQLLREGNVKISAVAQACGFSGVYHFCRAFRTRCGMTPSEYMLRNKETGG